MTHDFSALGIVPDKEKVLGGVDSAGMGLGRSVDAIEALLNFPSMHKGALDPHITWHGSWKQLPDAITLLQNRTISGKAVLRVG